MDYRKKTFPQLKKIADKVCSEWIRQKYANWKGETKCYTCSKTAPWRELQCGHYISRVYTNLRYYEPNLRPQCYSCNVMRHGNMDVYAINLERETKGILEVLNQWKYRPSKMKREDLVDIIEDFKKKISEIIN